MWAMRIVATHRMMSLFSALVVVVGALHAPHADSLVLCIEADGESTVEAADGESCASVEESMSHCSSDGFDYNSPRFNNAGADHCGECNDIPLMDHEAFSAMSTRYLSQDSFPVPSTGSLLCTLNVTPASQVYAAPNSLRTLSFSMTSLRSVSLQR